MGSLLLLFDNVSANYASRITEGAAENVRASRYRLVTKNLYGTDTLPEDVLDSQSPSGVILTPPLSDDRRILSLLEERKLPVVRIAPLLDLERGSCVKMDELFAAMAITQKLIDAGHRRIGFVRGPKEHLESIRRYNGYVGALGGAKIALDDALIVTGDFSRQSGRDLAPELFRRKPTAIFASNDEMALGIIDEARSCGVDIPQDISLVGFDDNERAARARPALTTVRQPLGKMGAKAAELLIGRCEGQTHRNVAEEVPFEIIERDSIATIDEEDG